ncbi:MAG TPA: hypothetical protein VJB92_03205 [Candidatus Paceibacterota bacterium]
MVTTATIKKIDTLNTLEIKGEKFVLLKKAYLDELLTLMRSFNAGERILRTGKTRSFNDFLKSVSRKNK